MVTALVDHQAVVALGQGGIDLTGQVGASNSASRSPGSPAVGDAGRQVLEVEPAGGPQLERPVGCHQEVVGLGLPGPCEGP